MTDAGPLSASFAPPVNLVLRATHSAKLLLAFAFRYGILLRFKEGDFALQLVEVLESSAVECAVF